MRKLVIFRETPLSTVERTKYTLESCSSPLESYVFYIEVDRRMRTTEEYLREIRLVIKKPARKRYSVKECARHIICDFVKSLTFDHGEKKILDLLEDQFK